MNIPAELLSLASEAVILLRGNKISYANRAAEDLLGCNCLGRSINDFIGTELGSVQSGSFTAAVNINGKNCIISTVSFEGLRAMILSPETDDSLNISPAVYSSLNSTLMSMSLSVSEGADLAAEFGDAALSRCINNCRRDYYKLNRQTSNAQYAENIMQHQLPFFPQLRDLSRLILSFIEPMRSLFPSKTVRLVQPDSLVIALDKQLISCAVGNLLENALSHAEADTITVTVSDSQDTVFISVSDNGIGIPQNKLPEVFSKYLRFTAPGDGHSGIGLTVVRGAAQVHGGTLLLESRENVGTAVRMSLSKNIPVKHGFYNTSITSEADISEVLTAFADILPEDALI